MKMKRMKCLALLLSMALLLPIQGYQSKAVAYAATPVFTETGKEIVGAGTTYQLEIKDKVAGSTYKWASSNTKIVKVSSKGVVTAVAAGTAKITCKITYPNKKTKTLTSNITVVIPATAIKISNAKLVNGAHVIKVGEKFDFNRALTPSASKDKTAWTIAGGDSESIRFEDEGLGIVVGAKVGKVILKATAVKTKTNANIKNSTVYDMIIIDVIENDKPTAAVTSAEITDSTEIKVIFDSPINPNTVIGTNGVLLDSVKLTLSTDSKGELAGDPGKLTAKFSSDNKVLTITTEKRLTGEYGINLTSAIQSSTGVPLVAYYKQLSYKDTVAPFITGVTVDDSGMIATIQFNEVIDFTDFQVSNASLVRTGNATTYEQSTINILNNRLNYVATADKKALKINLSKIAAADMGKTFSVTFTGIKDLSGNAPVTYTVNAYVYTDNTPKPQPKIQAVLRTAYNKITAIFDRPVQSGGYAQVGSGLMMQGIVDSQDSKRVHYTLSAAEEALSGMQSVQIGFWNGYNPIATDQSSNQLHTHNVNFTTEQTSPLLMTYEFDAKTNILTLNYNEEVTITSTAGIFNTVLKTVTDEIRSGTNINYVAVESNDRKVIKLRIDNMVLSGVYSFTLEQGFVRDNFKNNSIAKAIALSNAGSTANELPGPTRIMQSSDNLSKIYVEFATMLDVPSATAVSNYRIPGVTIISAEVINNTKDNGATIVLTVPDNSIDVTVERPVTINGVKGYNGSHSEIKEYTKMVLIKENSKPRILGNPTLDRDNLSTIKLTFSEEITGKLSVKVTQLVNQSNSMLEIPSTVVISKNTVSINLSYTPMNGTYVRIDIVSNELTDLSGNKAEIASPITMVIAY